jgi:hypothetical protein
MIIQAEWLRDKTDPFIETPMVDNGVPRVAGREQDLEAWAHCAGLGAALSSRQAAGKTASENSRSTRNCRSRSRKADGPSCASMTR